MKKLLNSMLILVLLPLALKSQSFRINIQDSIKTGNPGEEIVLGGEIINLTDQEVPIVMSRLTNEIPSDWTTSLCFQNCAPPWIDVLEGTLAANDSLEFSVHFFTSQTPGEGQVQLEISHPKVQTETFQLKASTSGNTEVPKLNHELLQYEFVQNYPNPFNSQTKIRFFTAPGIRRVELSIFDLTGKSIFKNSYSITASGYHEIPLNVDNLSSHELTSGIYPYRLDFYNSENRLNSLTSQFILIK